jgi:hypothetical protein
MPAHNKIIIILLAFLPILFACDAKPAPDRAAVDQPALPASDDAALSPELVAQNIHETDCTVLVLITGSRVTGPGGGPPPSRGYVNHVYTARVLETFRGPRAAVITYTVMAEADLKPMAPGHPLIVSLCVNKRGEYHVPDNGYVTPATQELLTRARRAGAGGPQRKSGGSICRE